MRIRHNSIRRRAFLAAGTLAAGAWSAWGRAAEIGRIEKSRVVIAAASRSDLQHLPLVVAEQLGYFRQEGLDVEVIEGAIGSADLYSGGFDQVLSLQARNRPTQAIVLQGRAPALALGVSTRAFPQFRDLADLKGLRIGIPAPGSSGHLMASLVLARAGLAAADASFIGIGAAPQAPGSLRAGQVDAICHSDPVMTMLEQKAEVRIVSDARTLKGTRQVFGGPMPSGCLHAPLEFVQKHPGTCQAVAHAMVRALKWLQTAGPRDLIRTVPEAYMMGDRALYLASFEKQRESISLDGLLPEEGARTALQALAGFDPVVRSEKFDLASTFNSDFVRRARLRYRL